MVTQPGIHAAVTFRSPWNKGKLTGQKPPLKLREIWAIRIRLQMAGGTRDLALFNLAIDSKLRGCDLVPLRVFDVAHGGRALSRATVVQSKTGRPVCFELTAQTRETVEAWIATRRLSVGDHRFPSRNSHSNHLSTRQYARIVNGWVAMIGLDPEDYGTHSLRRTKATLIYRRTRNLQAIQLLLGYQARKHSAITRHRRRRRPGNRGAHGGVITPHAACDRARRALPGH